jgi:hypothetical protein
MKLAKPPQRLVNIMGILLRILGQNESWGDAKMLISNVRDLFEKI